MAEENNARRRTISLLSGALLTSMLGGVGAYAKGYIVLYLSWLGGFSFLFAIYLVAPTLRDYRKAQGGARPLDLLIVLPFVALMSLVMSLALLGLAIGLFVGASILWDFAAFARQNLPTKSVLVTLTAFATVVVGALFFYFRLRQRFLYGLTEACFGVLIAAHRMSLENGSSLPSETAFYLAVLTAGVYLVVRGLDNMHQALKAKEAAALYTAALPGKLVETAGRMIQR